MTAPFGFDVLKSILHRRIAALPAPRAEGPNTRYAIPDAVVGALGLFCTQSPSFVESQRRLHHTKGQTNVHTLFDVAPMPCDQQIRKLLDPLAPRHLDTVFMEVVEGLEQPPMLAHLRVLGDPLLVALDGPHSFSSKVMQCHTCLTRQLSNGPTLSYHAAITPVSVCPGPSQVIALPPAYIMPQDGHIKQDCERAAGTRWLATHAEQVAPHGVTLLGDDLYSNQPFCAMVLPTPPREGRGKRQPPGSTRRRRGTAGKQEVLQRRTPARNAIPGASTGRCSVGAICASSAGARQNPLFPRCLP